MANSSVAVMTAGEKTKKIESLKGDVREAKQKLKELSGDYAKRMSRFVRDDVPAIATYAGAGAAIGGLLGYWLHDQMKEWFGKESYVGLLGTAALGVVVVVATPQMLKVSKKRIDSDAPIQAGLYGLGIGLIGAGAWKAYEDWPAA